MARRVMVSSRFWESAPRVFVVFGILTLLMTWPLAWRLTTDLPYGAADLWQGLWTYWWWKTAIFDLHQSPYYTHLLFHPFGTRLAFHAHAEVNQLAVFPISAWLGPVAAYNTATLAGIALSGLGAYLLARDLAGDGRAAMLAGLIFAFFPHHMEQTTEHLNLATMQFIPFVCLYFSRVIRVGDVRNALLLGVFFALNALGCSHYGIFLLLMFPLLLVFEWPARRTQSVTHLARTAGGLALAAVTAAVLVAPFFWPMFQGVAAGQDYVKPFVEDRGIDPVFLFLPTDHHPILGALTAGFYRTHRAYPHAGFYDYVGFTPLLLAAAALPVARRDRRVLAWFVIAPIFLVLALGAQPVVAGKQLHVTLPHALFASLPMLNTLRVANRFVLVTMLAVAVLAARGAMQLDRSGRRGWLVPVAAGLILFEYLWLPFPTQRVAFPPYLQTVASDPSAGAVLGIPFCERATCVQNQVFQIVHGRPVAGGYISSARGAGIAATLRDPVLGGLFGLEPTVPDVIDVAHLRALGFGTVIINTGSASETRAERFAGLGDRASSFQRRELVLIRGMSRTTMEAISARFQAAVGPPVYEDDRIRVFRLR